MEIYKCLNCYCTKTNHQLTSDGFLRNDKRVKLIVNQKPMVLSSSGTDNVLLFKHKAPNLVVFRFLSVRVCDFFLQRSVVYVCAMCYRFINSKM